MSAVGHPLWTRLRRLAREEDGTSTIPFIIFLPFFMLLVMSSLEMGMLMLRHVMLERALDLSVREVRMGLWTNPAAGSVSDHDVFKSTVCNRAGVIPDCMNVLRIELRPVSTKIWKPLASGPLCIDRSEPINPVTRFDQGFGDEMMLVRACAKFDPIFPTSSLGFRLPGDKGGAYALVSASAFFNEPD